MTAPRPAAVVLALAVVLAGCIPTTVDQAPSTAPVASPTIDPVGGPGGDTPTVASSPTPGGPRPGAGDTSTPASPDVALPTPIPLPAPTTSRLRIGLDRDPSALDPARAIDDGALMVVDALFDSLTRMSEDLTRVEPAAASSWEVSADGLVWTFTLRDATWHDGLPVTAQQFVRAFTHVAADAGGVQPFHAHLLSRITGWEAAQAGQELEGVRAPSTTTLEVTLDEPFGDLPAALSSPALAPRRRAGVDLQQPVGNGPFRMDGPWAHNQFIRVAAVADHVDAPRVGEVVFQIYAGERPDSLQLEDFRAGVLDVAAVPPVELEAVAAEYGMAPDGYSGPGLLEGVGDEAYWIGFNTAQAPFDDPQVRLGISQLLDRDRVIDVYTASSRTRATGIVPGGIPGSGTIDCAPCRHDPLSAATALDGFAERLDGPMRILTIDGVTNRGIATSLATAIRDTTGARVIVDAEPLGQWLAGVRAPGVQVFRAGWEASWPTMGGVLVPSFSSDEIGGDNLVRLADGPLDEAIAAAMPMTGSDGVALWQEAEQRVADLAAVAPVSWNRLNVVVADGVRGFRMAPTGQVDLSQVSVVE
ncbi:MAG TPA: ABC transporter substrate-binding protein [Nitriliruptoraceae bacterium]|nr:ABC transporter substrate-binding protein [Nitriliruptoraceae bacterium]